MIKCSWWQFKSCDFGDCNLPYELGTSQGRVGIIAYECTSQHKNHEIGCNPNVIISSWFDIKTSASPSHLRQINHKLIGV